MQRSIKILVGFLSLLLTITIRPTYGDEVDAPGSKQRWAIVTAVSPADGLADLLTAELSEWDGVELLERDQIDRVLGELKLNASGLVDNAKAVQFGKLVAADAILFIEYSGSQSQNRLQNGGQAHFDPKTPQNEPVSDDFRESLASVRLIETRTGVRLFDMLIAVDDVEKASAELARELGRTQIMLNMEDTERRYVGVVELHNEEPGATFDSAARALSVFLEIDLSQVPGVAVLERAQLTRLRDESDLTGLELKLRGSAYLVSGGLRRNDDGNGYQVTIEIVSLARKSKKSVQVESPDRNLAIVRQQVLEAIVKELRGTVTPHTVAVQQLEVATFARQRDWLFANGRLLQAGRMAEAAFALDPTRENLEGARQVYVRQVRKRKNLNYSITHLDALRATHRAHQLDLIYLQSLSPHEPIPMSGANWLDPTVELRATGTVGMMLNSIDSPEEQQERRQGDQLRLEKYRLYRDIIRNRGTSPLPLLMERLRLATVCAETPQQFDSDIRSLIAEFGQVCNDGQMRASFDDPTYITFLGALYEQISWSVPRSIVSSGENRRYWEFNDLKPLFEFLCQHNDANIRLIGLSGSLESKQQDGITAAKQLLAEVFELPSDHTATHVCSMAESALGRLRDGGQFDEYLESLITKAEQANNATIVIQWRWYWMLSNKTPPEKVAGWCRRVVSLIDKQTYPQADKKIADEARQYLTGILERHQGLAKGTLDQRKYPLGPWSQYMISSLKVRTLVPERYSSLLAVHVDQSEQARIRHEQLILVWDQGYGRCQLARANRGGGPIHNYGPLIRAGYSWKHQTGLGKVLVTSPFGIFLSAADRGFALVNETSYEIFGEEEGAPSDDVRSMAWLDGVLYVSYYPGSLYAFDPIEKSFRMLASSSSRKLECPLDGGGQYWIYKMVADPKSKCIWMAIEDAEGGSRNGVWKYFPATNEFQKITDQHGHLDLRTDSIFFCNQSGFHLISLPENRVMRLDTYGELDADEAFVFRHPCLQIGNHIFLPSGRLYPGDGHKYELKPRWYTGHMRRLDNGFIAFENQDNFWVVQPRDKAEEPFAEGDRQPFDRQTARVARLSEPTNALQPFQLNAPLMDNPQPANRFALRLDDQSSIVLTDSAGLLRPGQPATVEFWARLRSGVQTRAIFGDRTNFGANENQPSQGCLLGLTRASYLFHRLTPDIGTVALLPADDEKWCHWVFCFTERELVIFVDGRPWVRKLLTKDSWLPSPNEIRIGFSESYPPEYRAGLKGDLGGFRISSFCRYENAFSPPLAFERDERTTILLDFSQADGNRIRDTSGHGHDGTIANAKWIVGDAPPPSKAENPGPFAELISTELSFKDLADATPASE